MKNTDPRSNDKSGGPTFTMQSLQFMKRAANTLCSAAAMTLLVLAAVHATAAPREMTSAELERVGKHIWQNECAGTVDGLTSWNTGENFASLGIAHVIWYPAGKKGPFEESFPTLLVWLEKSGVAVPAWLRQAPYCPWPDRAAFLKDKDSARMKELRTLLASTVREQTAYIVHRLDTAAPAMQAAAGQYAQRVATNMQLLRQTAAGNFAMIDYVNFKGEGLNPNERYNGEGWGLLQVLTSMEATTPADAPRAFADAAKRVLTRRVNNSPPERKEKRWLQGWLNRCDSYAK